MALPRTREPWGGPVLLSALLHGGVVALLALNLSLCSNEVKLPPLPAHVKAVLVDRAQPVPQLAEPVPEPETAPEPEPPKPQPKKPEPKKPKPKPVSQKPEPKPAPKPAPKKPDPQPPEKPEPQKPEPKPEPAKPEPQKPAPPPDFNALLEREDRDLAMRADERRVSNRRVAEEAAADAAAEARMVADYTARIHEALRQRWNRAPSARNGMSVTLQVNLIPGGEVMGTPAVQKSSGDAAFDRSAQKAVQLASPLPVPADPALFNKHFRQFLFVARAEDLKQ